MANLFLQNYLGCDVVYHKASIRLEVEVPTKSVERSPFPPILSQQGIVPLCAWVPSFHMLFVKLIRSLWLIFPNHGMDLFFVFLFFCSPMIA